MGRTTCKGKGLPMLVEQNQKKHTELWKVSDNVMELKSSIIREILKVSSKPGVINFAGGLPAPELFPIEELKEIAVQVLDKYGPDCLQYSLSRGLPALRELLAKRATERGTPSGIDNILISNGAQQAIELVARAFIAPGDYILTENPTYVGALQAFNYYQAKYTTVDIDDEGMNVDQAIEKIERFKPKLIYTISNFQNPTGITMSLKRREQLVEVARNYNIPILDDNPYGDIRFSGERLPTLKSIGGNEVIAVRTFSKTLAPGMRIGWINGPENIIAQFEKVKQCADLHTSTFCQYIVYEYVNQGLLEPHIEHIKVDYRTKRDIMLKGLQEHFPPGISWTEPEGGLFLWLELPKQLSSVDLFEEAIENKVAYVYGQPFFPDGGGLNTLRLNFATASHEQIAKGIKRLGELFTKYV
ncbi:MAG: PLP-dependent aminotransferase family protein [bacterium]|nr:PLP-dependent aminotransferase family protein [bacterium]